MTTPTRRDFVRATTALSLAPRTGRGEPAAAQEAPALPARPVLTPAADFHDVSRGTPKPHTLKGEALVRARLTPETWRLDIVADPAVGEDVPRPAKIVKPVTLDLPTLWELGRKHEVRFLKAMQCLNIAPPLGQGLWEGVPLRHLVRLCGPISDVRRVAYWGYHNDDPKQLFRSSLSYTQAMETPPGELPAFVAYRLNGEAIPLVRGGPVRMVVPWAYGFKSIKWLQTISLTNDYRANDTYAKDNNDPESYQKTAAYLDDVAGPVRAGRTVAVRGTVVSGLSGLRRVEYWVRPAPDKTGDLAEDDPAWRSATWVPARIDDPPNDWTKILPNGVPSQSLLGFDPASGRPKTWPTRYGMAAWSATIEGLPAGAYEVRARAVDLNDDAQPEPRPLQKSGRNAVPVRRFVVA